MNVYVSVHVTRSCTVAFFLLPGDCTVPFLKPSLSETKLYIYIYMCVCVCVCVCVKQNFRTKFNLHVYLHKPNIQIFNVKKYMCVCVYKHTDTHIYVYV